MTITNESCNNTVLTISNLVGNIQETTLKGGNVFLHQLMFQVDDVDLFAKLESRGQELFDFVFDEVLSPYRVITQGMEGMYNAKQHHSRIQYRFWCVDDLGDIFEDLASFVALAIVDFALRDVDKTAPTLLSQLALLGEQCEMQTH